MHNFQLLDTSIMSYDFFDEKTQPPHVHADIELFYLLEGKIILYVDKDEYTLSQDDFVMINSNVEHKHQAVSDVLYSCLQINYNELCRKLGAAQVFLSCKIQS